VEREQWRSSHDIARELELSQLWALKILHDDKTLSISLLANAHVFPDNPVHLQICEWPHQHAMDELLSHNILWTDAYLCVRVRSAFTSAWDNPHAMRECGY
jgi:hypothetical protein